jgi:histidinol-phosphatase
VPALDLSLALDVARRAAEAGGAAAMRHFRTGLRVEKKPDRSPVTAADREADAAIVAVIRAAFPDHSILAEESGRHEGSATSRWIVDPLDGTRGFSRGGTHWGPLVALEHEGEVVAGAMSRPASGSAFWAARGMGAYQDGARLRVSAVDDWRDATLQLGETRVLVARPGVVALATAAASTRSFGDLAGAADLLLGRADAWIEGGVQPWDVAPLIVLVEEAGGRFTDPSGARTIEGGWFVATNGLLHAHALGALGI